VVSFCDFKCQALYNPRIYISGLLRPIVFFYYVLFSMKSRLFWGSFLHGMVTSTQNQKTTKAFYSSARGKSASLLVFIATQKKYSLDS